MTIASRNEAEEFRDVGPWSLVKNDIITDYGAAYTTIMSRQPWCKGIWYVDAFAGDPQNLDRTYLPFTTELVDGSASRALKVDPPFTQFHFIDLSSSTVERLNRYIGARSDVAVHHGDANDVI